MKSSETNHTWQKFFDMTDELIKAGAADNFIREKSRNFLDEFLNQKNGNDKEFIEEFIETIPNKNTKNISIAFVSFSEMGFFKDGILEANEKFSSEFLSEIIDKILCESYPKDAAKFFIALDEMDFFDDNLAKIIREKVEEYEFDKRLCMVDNLEEKEVINILEIEQEYKCFLFDEKKGKTLEMPRRYYHDFLDILEAPEPLRQEDFMPSIEVNLKNPQAESLVQKKSSHQK